ncbi:unnamed protein product [Orchesella dallaii]|uniref:Uncharacterized protein n=1 Tax=Orchesella dallaii TaxID=48710 RepID=A0ABP1PX92_9HEXA
MRPLARIYFSSILTNVGFVLLIFCVRALQAVIFFRVIGKDSMSLPVIIVNHAVNDAGDPYNDPANTTHLPCSLWNMSCEFVKPHDEILSMSVCRNENKTEVEARKMWGYIVIPRNFRKNCAAWKGHESYGNVWMGYKIRVRFSGWSESIHALDLTTFGFTWRSTLRRSKTTGSPRFALWRRLNDKIFESKHKKP